MAHKNTLIITALAIALSGCMATYEYKETNGDGITVEFKLKTPPRNIGDITATVGKANVKATAVSGGLSPAQVSDMFNSATELVKAGIAGGTVASDIDQ